MSTIENSEGRDRPTATTHDVSEAVPAWLKRPTVVLPVILLAVVALYAPSLNDWFQTDDLLLLRAARVVPFWTFVREAFDFTDFQPLDFYAYRPLYFISADVLYLTFGLQPTAYHVVVLNLHLVNVLLTFHVARRLTGRTGVGYTAAAIFGLHPVYFYSVAWISGLNSVAATTGQLACTAILLTYDERPRWYWLVGAVIAYGLALLFHQEIFVAPGVVLVYLVLRRPDWHKGLVSFRALAPFVVFGALLLTFLIIQGQAAEEAGFLTRFQPSKGTLQLAAGTLSIAAAPTGGAGISLQHYATALVVVATLTIVACQGGTTRGVLVFAIAWYASLLILSILFIDGVPPSRMQAAMARKMYSAGPAIGIIGALVLVTFWERSKEHVHRTIVISAMGVVLVAAATFAFAKAHEQQAPFDHAGDETKQFHDSLVAANLALPEGGSLYVAGAPFTLLFLTCPGPLCYLDNLVAVVYGRDVLVHTLTVKQAKDPTALAKLGVDDRLFCYRC